MYDLCAISRTQPKVVPTLECRMTLYDCVVSPIMRLTGLHAVQFPLFSTNSAHGSLKLKTNATAVTREPFDRAEK